MMYAVGTVPGLHLQVLPSGGRSWVLRVTVGQLPGSDLETTAPKTVQVRREIGLGGYPEVTLAMAHERAREMRRDLKAGIDPIVKKMEARAARNAALAASITFEKAASRYMAVHSPTWRNKKHADQWQSTIDTYVNPVLGRLRVSDIQVEQVVQVLEPIWRTKTETASRVRGRIEQILDWAKSAGFRTGDNPAAWRGSLQAHLPRAKAVAKTQHHAALPIATVRSFMAKLRDQQGMGARALEFVILTAARSGEVRGATWAEIDLEAEVWTVPGERMKAGKEHRVPLSADAVTLLNSLDRVEGTDLIFPSAKGKPLSDMTLTAVLRRMKVPAVPHGFRSTFRDWAAEQTNHPREVAEMALAHTIENKVEAAYRRGDLFEKRRVLMQDWARFCSKTTE